MRRQLLVLLLAAALLAAGCDSMKFEAKRAENSNPASAPMAAPAPMAAAGVMAFDAQTKADNDSTATAPAEPPPGQAPESNGQPPAQAIVPKIIHTGSAVLRSKDLDADVKKIEDKVKTLNGYVAASTQDVSNELNKTANLTIKIPAEQFDGFMAYLQAGFKKEQIGTSSEDVGEEYVDVESRLNNFRLEEKRLIELLADRTGKLSDVLEVERELARVREEIERMTGRLRYLENRVGYSTITVSLIQSKTMVSVEDSWSTRFWHNVKQTVLEGLEMLGGTLRGLFLLLVGGLPFWIIGAVVIWLVVRHRRKRRAAAAACPPPLPPAPPKAG